jgi:AraC family transcriptional regulator
MLNEPPSSCGGGVEVSRRLNPAGPVVLSPAAHHRVSLHLSPYTVTSCSETGRSFTRARGDIDITPAGQPGGFEAQQPSASLEVRIAADFFAGVAGEMGIEPSRAAPPVRHMLRDAQLEHLLFALDAGRRRDASSDLFEEGVARALAARLLADPPSPADPAPPSAAAMRRVIDYIEAHLDGKLTLVRLAGIAGVSRSSLQRAFKAEQGMALHRYVMLRRVERARTLVLQGRTPMSEAALLAGFAHQSHMARWMRRVLGATPTELLGSAG